MMALTEEQKMMRDLAREFAQNEIEPVAAEIDETSTFPLENLKKMAELGLLGIPFEEEYGGSGMNIMAFALAMEEFGVACGSTALSVAAHVSLCSTPIYMFGSEAQKKKYLPDLLNGNKIGSFCLSEPASGSDAGALTTRAQRDGDGYVINGSKQWVTNGGYASTFVVFAKTNPDAGTKGISAFIVDKDMPGVVIGKKEDKMGLRASDTRQITFENVRVPAENLLGEENKGFIYALKTLDGGRIGIGAMSVGLGRAALEHAARYADERVAFGKKIGRFQAIQWYIADMATQLEAARLLVYQAAQLRDAGQPYSKEAAMAKLFASESAMKAADKGIQILGGYGYSRDYPLERIFRDTKLMEIGEGTSEVQRIVISKLVMSEINKG
ncbi:MAG: acyl-CoA dehydrogenase [Deferribacteres bacterium]|nr:acyl-CoA dehydrogenase [candidate division KSB1 bacterium]MCB9508868.1 acyl-CoA dehydrogenase [Deferribacteres bacterium]